MLGAVHNLVDFEPTKCKAKTTDANNFLKQKIHWKSTYMLYNRYTQIYDPNILQRSYEQKQFFKILITKNLIIEKHYRRRWRIAWRKQLLSKKVLDFYKIIPAVETYKIKAKLSQNGVDKARNLEEDNNLLNPRSGTSYLALVFRVWMLQKLLSWI